MKYLALARLYFSEVESAVRDYVDAVGILALALQVFLLLTALLIVLSS